MKFGNFTSRGRLHGEVLSSWCRLCKCERALFKLTYLVDILHLFLYFMQGIFELTKSLDFVYIHFAQTFVIDLFIHKVVDDDESKSFKCKLKTVSLGSPFPRLNS